MLTRTHIKDDAPSVATYSDCERYRYSLVRTWDPEGKRALFVMLNPSTATEVQNDPTVERCERRARTLGFGSFEVTNIFAWRDTDPKAMRAATDPVGPLNDDAIENGSPAGRPDCLRVGHARGPPESRCRGRAPFTATSLPLFHLGLSKAGHPKHPLYIAYNVQPVLWSKS